MPNPLIAKLEHFTRLSADDRRAVEALATGRIRRLRAREDIIREGDRPRDINLILDGWACRYKTLEDGRRQIIAFFLPGDLCDQHVFILKEMDHSVGAISAITYAEIPRETMEAIYDTHPRITRGLWWDTLVISATQREWVVNLGQRSAIERIGHLLCELFIRLRMVGRTDGDSCDFPLTQADLADAAGLTPVHVNRTLQELRASGLIVLHGKRLTIPDLARLQEASLFSANYLHLDRDGAHLDANDAEAARG